MTCGHGIVSTLSTLGVQQLIKDTWQHTTDLLNVALAMYRCNSRSFTSSDSAPALLWHAGRHAWW
jgi:hypothetical protein